MDIQTQLQNHQVPTTRIMRLAQDFAPRVLVWDRDENTISLAFYSSPSVNPHLDHRPMSAKAAFKKVQKNQRMQLRQALIDLNTDNFATFKEPIEVNNDEGKVGFYRVFLSTEHAAEEESNHHQVLIMLIDVSVQTLENRYTNAYGKVLQMIAKGLPTQDIYDAIAGIYETRHPGLRCSMLELKGNTLFHGGAPSLPQSYCDAVNGLQNGPDVGSCGTSTYTGERVIVEDISTDPKWKDIKHIALPHGMRCCWSEPIFSSQKEVLGAFGMYLDYPAKPDAQQSEDLKSAAMLTGLVMERDRYQKKIHDLAYRDPLTGLYSRSSLTMSLQHKIDNYSTAEDDFAVLYIDLDNFKQINDSLGHDIGDAHLVAMAKTLQDIAPENSVTARIGGDEFCVIINRRGLNKSLAQVAQTYINAVSKPTWLCGRRYVQGCSVGIAKFPKDADTFKTITKAADIALYNAKNNGKNQYAFYRRSLSSKIAFDFQFEQSLREAIDNESMFLEYQPQIDIASGKVVGFEALCRWNHPELGRVEPYRFIDVAERTGLMPLLTEKVLYQAFNQLAVWHNLGFDELLISVNISASHFFDREFIPLIDRVTRETGIKPHYVILEITESVVQTSKKSLKVINTLKDKGFKIAIDDFGTGYSSFASLKHIHVDGIKIDRSFINEYLEDEKTQELVKIMVTMAHKLGFAVVAEGIEKRCQVESLKQIGCNFVQGFFFSRPLAKEQVPGFIHSTL